MNIVSNIILTNKKVNIIRLTFKSFDRTGYLETLKSAINLNPDIINISAAGKNNTHGALSLYAKAMRRNILIIAASGNDGENIKTYPNGYTFDNIISVMSASSSTELEDYSNYNQDSVDISSDGDYVDGCGNTHSGTSFAAPRITALAASILYKNPKLNIKDLKSKILNSGESSEYLRKYSKSGRYISSEYLKKNLN
jgi:subtilisin family serine protease